MYVIPYIAPKLWRVQNRYPDMKPDGVHRAKPSSPRDLGWRRFQRSARRSVGSTPSTSAIRTSDSSVAFVSPRSMSLIKARRMPARSAKSDCVMVTASLSSRTFRPRVDLTRFWALSKDSDFGTAPTPILRARAARAERTHRTWTQFAMSHLWRPARPTVEQGFAYVIAVEKLRNHAVTCSNGLALPGLQKHPSREVSAKANCVWFGFFGSSAAGGRGRYEGY
jgi:hypothetical protein